MLSTSIVKNVDQASHYFSEKDNYYTREEGFLRSEWWGKGAEKLNLTGKVDGRQFTELLQGKLAHGEQLGTVIEKKIKHRPGWDLTFSAPKSVSILAILGEDKRLIEAHRQAVHVALSYIERSCSQARIKMPEGTVYQNTKNMTAALYQHDLSREKDPQLHTHSVVLNMTERLDGKWRSQASQIGRYDQKATGEINGFIERVNHHRRFLSKIYETELAWHVRQLGYEITTDTLSGKFEIAGVPQEVIQFFSKRRQQIEKQLEQKGLSGGKAANVAALATRNVKEEGDREKLKEEWNHHIKRLRFDYHKIIKNTWQKHPIQQPVSPVPENGLLEAVKCAANALSVFQATFTLEEMITEAADYAIQNTVKFESLLTAVNTQISSGELISFPNDQGKTVLMAKSTLDDEKRLTACLLDKKMLLPLVDTSNLASYLMRYQELNATQHTHLKTVFNDDRIVFIQGETARNALVEPIMKIAKSAKLEVEIISPSLVGSKQFAKKAKLLPDTFWGSIKSLFIDDTPRHYSVMQFLSRFSEQTSTHNQVPHILIVDNAHLLSTRQKADLVEWNTKHSSKLILLGEMHTLLPQKTGTQIDDLIQHGIQIISMRNMQSEVVDKNHTIFSAISKIAGHINEVKEKDERLYTMASHYARLRESIRQQSWLVAHHKLSIESLNQTVHEELKRTQTWSKSILVNALVPVFLSDGKAVQATTYQTHQLIRFNEDYSSLGIERGEYLRVIKTYKKSNRVVLRKENDNEIIWRPDKIAGKSPGKVELFNEKVREFCVGESILFHRSVKARGIVKGERATIMDIHQQKLKLKNDEGKIIIFDLENPWHRHMDYGYAVGLHAIAHERPHTLITELPAKAFNTDQRRFYQIVSQPKETWIYTDNYQGLLAHLEKKTGDRFTAHDTLAKAEEIKKNLHSLYELLEQQIVRVKGDENKAVLSRTAVEAVDYALHHLAEREAGFTHKQLMLVAMEHALGRVNQQTLTSATVAMEKAGILLRGTRSDGVLWTTVGAVKMEREIIILCEKDRGQLQPLVSDKLLATFCDPNKLEQEQIAAVKAITQCRDRVLAIQGHPGTGKTTMLATVADVLVAKELLTAQGYEILGLAPTHVAVMELTSRGIQAQTLDSFITGMKIRFQEPQPLKRSHLVMVIDEASMVSNQKMLEALKIAHQLDCRVIPAGDVRQLSAIEAGKPHDLIQNTAVETRHLVNIRRQKNDDLKQAVQETINYNFRAALKTLKNSITEVAMPPYKKEEGKSWAEHCEENRIHRVSILVSDYFSYPKHQRDTIQVITPGHDDRLLANSLIREQLKNEGTLIRGNDQSFDVLTSKSLTQIERCHATNLSVGDVLRFRKRESNHIKAGDYLTITEINKDQSLVKLKNEKAKDIIWQVPEFDKNRIANVEVFTKETRNLQAGDIIRWTRSDKKNALFSSEAVKVTSIDKNQVKVELPDKKFFIFDAKNLRFQHWEHGYAATVYAVQGKTKDIVLAHLESFRENLTTQPAFLVSLTRVVNEFRLYTDSISDLLQEIEKNAGTKLSSLEVIGEYPSGKIVEDHPGSRPISDKFISSFNKSMSRNANKLDKTNLDAYKNRQHEIHSEESTRQVTIAKEIEREI